MSVFSGPHQHFESRVQDSGGGSIFDIMIVISSSSLLCVCVCVYFICYV